MIDCRETFLRNACWVTLGMIPTVAAIFLIDLLVEVMWPSLSGRSALDVFVIDGLKAIALMAVCLLVVEAVVSAIKGISTIHAKCLVVTGFIGGLAPVVILIERLPQVSLNSYGQSLVVVAFVFASFVIRLRNQGAKA